MLIDRPHLTFNFSNQSLKEHVKEISTPKITKLPLSYKGHKKMHKVGKASEKVYGITKRDGLIRARLISR